MRWLRLAAPALVLGAWLGGSIAQQGQPPAGTPPATTPPPARPPAGTVPPAAPPAEAKDDDAAPPDKKDEESDVFVPTEELQPDAAVTFPVDI